MIGSGTSVIQTLPTPHSAWSAFGLFVSKQFQSSFFSHNNNFVYT